VRLFLVVVLYSLVAAAPPQQRSPTTSVVWIYDCSQSHYSTLVPPYPERFGITWKPVESMVQGVADNMGLGTEVLVLSFGTGLHVSGGWVRTRTELAAAMDCGDTRNGPSPMWDAVYRAVEILVARPGARAILMVTDGRASANVHGYQEGLDRAIQAGVRVNIAFARTELFRTGRPPITLNANRPGDPAERLKKLADGTGGKYGEMSVWDLQKFFADVARGWAK
jgi:hypothetical protein